MARCARCSAEVSVGSRFCPACGAGLSTSSESPTEFASDAGAARRIVTSSPGAAAFAPGEVVAERYRIVGLLGRGGMGEVYRADDLRLGAAVALKFLPREVERDPRALERFHAEVRTARQVSHPHVCRVYDIGDVAGRQFLSMEYVDGEDLATLLRRIGRLPPAKAVEIARQLCAGLAAAHEKGVLHRDLKPANVMLDGHGRARITDFGLAVLTDEAAAELAGTPAYMSPEQLAGEPATVQSDLYSLGLLLYEVLTGKRAFEAGSLAEWRRVHSELQPTSPSLHTGDLDPAVERVILSCLEKDPAKRPRSAAQVALALPGGDPLAAAIAAGETPSPEMVAAAGGEGALAPSTAWALLIGLVALVGIVAAISPYSTDLGLAPMRKNPDVLEDRARAIVQRFGYTDPPADHATWLQRDYDPLRWLADHLPSTEWRGRLAGIGAPVLLHLRRAARPLVPLGSTGEVTASDPAADAPGDIHVVVDSAGRLRELQAAPPRWGEVATSNVPFPEDAVFEETGLERTRFESANPEWIPRVPFDERREWTGTRAEVPEIPLRLSAATFGGRLVSVAVLGPWARNEIPILEADASVRVAQYAVGSVILLTLLTATIFARRNLRLSRGDRRGAFRLATVAFVLSMLSWLATAHVVATKPAALFGSLMLALAEGAFTGLSVWVVYVALEPYIRRRMPELLVGWARILEGRWRDARVGRDVLMGLACGAALALLGHVVNGLPTWFSFPGQTTIPFFGLGGHRLAPLGALTGAALNAIVRAVFSLTILFLFRLFLPRAWLATAGLVLTLWLFGLGAENVMLEVPAALLGAILMAVVTTRLGLLALVGMWLAVLLLVALPAGVGLSTWYGAYSGLTLVLLLGLAGWSFVTSLGGRSPFGSMTLDA